jgi:hypothetical protein
VSLYGVVGVEDLELLARSGGRLEARQKRCRREVASGVREEVACRVGAVGDEGKDLRDEPLLNAGFLWTLSDMR